MSSAALDIKTFAQASADLRAVLDTATLDCLPVMISREDGEAAVVISLSAWNSLQETIYVNASAEQRRDLDNAIAELNAGRGIETELGAEGYYVPVRKAAAE